MRRASRVWSVSKNAASPAHPVGGRPDGVPQPEIRDLRRLRRYKAPRAPSLRVLVRWALKCNSAEQLGHRIRQRYERQQRRHGIEPADTRAEAEFAEQLDKPLADRPDQQGAERHCKSR